MQTSRGGLAHIQGTSTMSFQKTNKQNPNPYLQSKFLLEEGFKSRRCDEFDPALGVLGLILAYQNIEPANLISKSLYSI